MKVSKEVRDILDRLNTGEGADLREHDKKSKKYTTEDCMRHPKSRVLVLYVESGYNCTEACLGCLRELIETLDETEKPIGNIIAVRGRKVMVETNLERISKLLKTKKYKVR